MPEYRPFRAMTIINANLLVDAERLEFQPTRLLAAVGWLLVPVICDVVVGEPLYGSGSRREFMEALEDRMQDLAGRVQRNVLE